MADHHVTSHDVDMRSDFDIDFLWSTCIYLDASPQEEDNDARIMSQALLVQKLLARTFLPKTTILTFLDTLHLSR